MRKTKEEIRKETLTELNNQQREEIFKKSKIIKEKLFSLPEFKNAQYVMLYASLDKEVNTDDIIDEALEAGKKVILPRRTSLETIVPKEISDRKSDLEKNTYGIREPKRHLKDIPPERIDLIVVPGVAFDEKKRRIGRGKGCYDRFLRELPPGKTIIGLAFNFQVLKSIPEDSHDIPVSKIITD
ncbi:MAG: 5-formyltetrahydrofolate cyclo-ligase [Candidatus Omnitrophica bacterium]|nr:5-formyltetrahydrofolate cyclo-ligase [Candidatus Omnitrophota bacterium]